MKVLFVGEGRHDIGAATFNPQPRPAAGVVTVLAKRVSSGIGEESVALAWREVPVLDRKRGRGFESKVESAIFLASRKYGCGGTVCVVDQDRDPGRLSQMEKGRIRGLEVSNNGHAVVCATAVESIDAWTLVAPSAIASVLGVDVERIHQIVRPIEVERLYERSGKPEHRPKALLDSIAQLLHESDSTEFRERVAEATDVSELECHCPRGFKPFADALRAAFGPATPATDN